MGPCVLRIAVQRSVFHKVTLPLLAQGFGYALSLLGFFWYNYIKMQPAPAPVYAPVPVRDTDGAVKP